MELYLEQLEAGQCPDRESFLSHYPEIAKELAGQLEALEFLHFTAPQLTDANASAAEQEISARATLGDFRLIKPIGRGGIGIVYEAEQLSLGRRVAVKVLPFAAMLDPRQLKRFQNEARAAATLEHPHIVPIHFVGQERGVHFYAMQLIEGQSLAEVVRDMRVAPNAASQLENVNPKSVDATHRSKLDPVEELKLETDAKDCMPTAVGANLGQGILSHPSTLNSSASRREFYRTIAQLGAQAAEALQHAHDQGIIHRDIKPGNLMVDCAGKLWVTDFGLARLETNDSITAEGDLMGTLAYMSPEQLSAKSITDSRSDIYSLGATLYELLTRERPFQRRNESSKLLPTVLPDQVPPPSRFDRNIPLDLQTIVLKAMSVEPNDRYLTARTMADDLRSFAAGLAIRARPPSYSERAFRLAMRHPRLLTLFGLACIMLTGVLGLSTLLVWRANQQSRDLLFSVREHSDRVEELLYLSDMQLAYQAWESRNRVAPS